MAGLFDNVFGSAGGLYSDMLSPEQQAAVRRQSMLTMAAKLLEGSGPSPVRRTIGQTLGGVLNAGLEAQQFGQTNAVQQMLMRQKLDEAKAERLQNEQIRKMIGAGDVPIDTINAPVETAGRVGPTMQRAAMPTTAVNPLLAGLNDQQRAILQVTPTSKVPDVLAGFQKDASAMSEVTGQPFEVTDATGRPILVQQTKGGKLTTLEGFGPKREIVLENMGGRTVAIDKKSLKGGETFQRDMTPGEVASNRVALGNLGVAQGNLSLARQNFARGNYQLKEGTDGQMFYVPTTPGAAAVPVMGQGGQPFVTQSQAPEKFSTTAKKLNDLAGVIKSYRQEVESDKVVFPTSIPLPFDAKIPLPTGADSARMRGKYQALLMGVKDLYELGALTGPDMGIISEQLTNPASISGVFTSRNAMKEQITVLEDMLARAKANTESAYKRKLPAASETRAPRLVTNPTTGMLEYRED